MEIKITVRDSGGEITLAQYYDGGRFYDKLYDPPVEDEVLSDIMDYAEKRIKEGNNAST